jgi:DNA-directed RNA polymerase subunit E'/Rpb7
LLAQCSCNGVGFGMDFEFFVDIGFMNSQVHAQNQIAEIYSAYDEKSDSFKTNDRARLVKAKFHYQKSVEIYRKSQTLYAPTQAEKDHLIKIEGKISQLENNNLTISGNKKTRN